MIRIDIPSQTLDLLDDRGHLLRRYLVSSGARGVGEKNGSYCTPRGRHVIRAKIGAGREAGTVFVERRPTGEIYGPELAARFPGRDWILTRILWLSGCEPGFNRLGDVDTMRRFIYIHGTPDDVPLGQPGSKGCVRMRNSDIIELFDRVTVGTVVEIDASNPPTAEVGSSASLQHASGGRGE
jgi:lipoprotein-anchoring transpeptidase ErfK/SrfK